jgi:hypothetical protein
LLPPPTITTSNVSSAIITSLLFYVAGLEC